MYPDPLKQARGAGRLLKCAGDNHFAAYLTTFGTVPAAIRGLGYSQSNIAERY